MTFCDFFSSLRRSEDRRNDDTCVVMLIIRPSDNYDTYENANMHLQHKRLSARVYVCEGNHVLRSIDTPHNLSTLVSRPRLMPYGQSNWCHHFSLSACAVLVYWHHIVSSTYVCIPTGIEPGKKFRRDWSIPLQWTTSLNHSQWANIIVCLSSLILKHQWTMKNIKYIMRLYYVRFKL
jgi:hypothetical protein